MCITLHFEVMNFAIYQTIQVDGLFHFIAVGCRLLEIILEENLCFLQIEIISLLYALVNRL